MCCIKNIVMSKPHRSSERERHEAFKTLAEKYGITRVDEVYEDGETLLSRAAGRAGRSGWVTDSLLEQSRAAW